MKTDSSGNVLWAKILKGDPGFGYVQEDAAFGVAVDSQNNIIVGGTYNSIVYPRRAA